VKVFVKERYVLRRFADANDNFQRQNMRLVRIWGLFFPLVSFLSGLTLLMLLWFGGRALITGEISAGEFVATLSYLQMLIWPMMGAGFTVNMLQRGAASLARVNEVLSAPVAIESADSGRTRSVTGGIEIRSLSYHYPGSSEPAIEDLSLTVQRGDMVGILGRTGSGKTTVVNLLYRMLDPPEGSVFVDGTDVRDYHLDTLRAGFGVVPQNSFLFSATVEDNIRFARPDADEATVSAAGALAAIDSDVAGFPQGWKTIVGERGVTLSGGQRQRIAIARALISDPEILVLDDALSAVDTRTEERILQAVLEHRRGKTTIVISNRVSTLQGADAIYILDRGRIIQTGTHAQLVQQAGLYREIYELQQQERAETTRGHHD
jgi:ATP-binding cassette subfamily B protein